ncbi:MAG: hypothetical protein WBZ00_03860, partial [Solirubrobacterales bacterium]
AAIAAQHDPRRRRLASYAVVTLIWFVIWLIANNVGGNEPLELDPVNAWTASLILAIALDINRPQWVPGKGK